MEKCREPLIIRGPRKRKRAQRLARLGLLVQHTHRDPGRPKRKQDDKADREALELMGLPSETLRWLARNAPLGYKPVGSNIWKDDRIISYSGRDSERIRRLIRSHYEEQARMKAKKPQGKA